MDQSSSPSLRRRVAIMCALGGALVGLVFGFTGARVVSSGCSAVRDDYDQLNVAARGEARGDELPPRGESAALNEIATLIDRHGECFSAREIDGVARLRGQG